MSVTVSVLTLTFIAHDRYHAICNPLRHIHSPRSVRATMIIAGIWLAAMLVSMPSLWLHAESPLDRFPCKAEDIFYDLSRCVPPWTKETDTGMLGLKVSSHQVLLVEISMKKQGGGQRLQRNLHFSNSWDCVDSNTSFF